VRHAAREGSDTAGLKRELLRLVLIVLLIDGGFVALYLLTPLRWARGTLKLGYTVLWTGVTLLVVLRGLGRVRALRWDGAGSPVAPSGFVCLTGLN
jgi:hypothetical protein